jgi:6-pyruvoyl-tetrahydropterin synthase
MNLVLEEQGFKLFQPISLRSTIVPQNIMLDTTCLIHLLVEKRGKMELLKHVKNNQDQIWRGIFNFEKRIFKQKNYNLNYTLQTDGISVSLVFIHKKYSEKESRSSCSTDNTFPFHDIEDLHDEQLERFKEFNIVGADPGKFNLLYMADGDRNKLRYTAFQRRMESKSKRNRQILLKEKLRNGVNKKEKELSDHNSKTVNYEKFKTYLREKNKLNFALRSFYERALFRKMKWRHFVYTKKSEDRFLNKIGETFGKTKPVLIAYGDWSRQTQMKHFMPTVGVGLRKVIAKRFQTVSINEFRTSKLCCRCSKELSHLKVERGGNQPKTKVYRCLVCEGCASFDSKKTVFVTRDLNSALNIRNLAEIWLKKKERPKEFTRSG